MSLTSENTVRSIEGTLVRKGTPVRPRPSSVARYCDALGLAISDYEVPNLLVVPPSYVDFRSESPPAGRRQLDKHVMAAFEYSNIPN